MRTAAAKALSGEPRHKDRVRDTKDQDI
jgi:hypothetical protein